MGDEAEPAPAEPVPAEAADPEAAAAAPEAAEAAPEAAEAAPEASDAVPEAPPGETELDIRFVIVPEGFSHTRRFALATTVAEVKAMCEEDLKIPVPNMKLVHAGEELFDGQTLESSGLKGGGLSQVELQIVYLEEHITPAPAYVMPDVVSVEVQFGADIPPKLIQVRQPALQSRPRPQSQPSRHRMHRCGSGSAHHRPRGHPPPHTPRPRRAPPRLPLPSLSTQVPIVRAMPEKKPFLGGFRSRKTAIEYHHASSQTDPKVRSEDEPLPPPKFHRETQTAVQQTRSQITVREAGTQMEVHGHAVVEERDVLLAPLPYFDSEQLAELRLQKAIDAQRYTRGWFARCQAAALRRRQAEEAEAARQAELRQQAEVQERHKQEIQRRMHPQKRADFEVLYNELEAWRVQETARINEAAADPESPTSEQVRLARLAAQRAAEAPPPCNPRASPRTRACSRLRAARERCA